MHLPTVPIIELVLPQCGHLTAWGVFCLLSRAFSLSLRSFSLAIAVSRCCISE